MIRKELKELMIAEGQLGRAATSALDAETDEAQYRAVVSLLLLSAVHIDVVKDPNHGYDHKALARETLLSATLDSRLAMGNTQEELDIDVRLQQQLYGRQAQLPKVIAQLEQLIQRSSN